MRKKGTPIVAKSKRKTTTRKKTSPKKAAASRSSAKRKKSTKKKTASRRATTKKKKKTAAKKKSTARKKSTATRTKKKTAKKKTKQKKKTTKKKVTSKKAGTRKTKKKTSGKKKSAKRAASTTKKKTSGKKAPAVKSSKKKTAGKKTSKKDSGGEAGSSAKTISKKRGRSVAEVASGAKTDDQGYVFINGRRVRMISTRGKVIPKKKRETAQPLSEEQEQPKKPLKTHLSRKELNHYKQLLMIKRAELVGDLSAMEAEALRSNVGNVSHMPIHMADIGSDAYEQDFMLGLAEAERKQIREIDEALQRIEDKTYGVCLYTGKPIPKARLDAKPWARYTIEAARIMESQQP